MMIDGSWRYEKAEAMIAGMCLADWVVFVLDADGYT